MSIFSTVSMYLLNLVQSIYLQEIPLAIIKCSCGLHFSAITNYLDVPGGLNVSPNISCHFFHPKWLRRLSPFNRVVIPGSKKFIYLSSSKPTYYLVLSYSQFYYVIVSAFTPCSRGRAAFPRPLPRRPLVTLRAQSLRRPLVLIWPALGHFASPVFLMSSILLPVFGAGPRLLSLLSPLHPAAGAVRLLISCGSTTWQFEVSWDPLQSHLEINK